MSDDIADDPEYFARLVLVEHGLAAANLTLLNISENATYAVDDPTTGERTVLRLHRPSYHTTDAIRSELAWVESLRAAGVVATCRPIPTPDGRFVVTSSHLDGRQRHAVRFSWLPGEEPRQGRLVKDFATLGAMTAELHVHARCWQPPPGFRRLTWDYEQSLGLNGHWGRWQDGLGMGAAELRELTHLDRGLRERLAAWGTSPDRFGLIHADMRLANLLVDGDHISVIDFDDCGHSWFLYDLGSSLSFMEHDAAVPELVDSWVLGYRDVAALSAADIDMLPTFIMMRRLLLVAWIGSHPGTDLATTMGVEFTGTTVELACAYHAGRFARI